ncbi:hypothetical protein ACIA8E_34565 [Streptomyces sp. NPDC051664]|uniref:hypothetical protein n=1 Tax=Streptomyces sp. NPDC051664 TaxID=3365668 RepID=UPI0037A59B2A
MRALEHPRDAWQRFADQQAAVLAALSESGRAPHVVARLAEFQAAITDSSSA